MTPWHFMYLLRSAACKSLTDARAQSVPDAWGLPGTAALPGTTAESFARLVSSTEPGKLLINQGGASDFGWHKQTDRQAGR